jgi:hypothetical protein
MKSGARQMDLGRFFLQGLVNLKFTSKLGVMSFYRIRAMFPHAKLLPAARKMAITEITGRQWSL